MEFLTDGKLIKKKFNRFTSDVSQVDRSLPYVTRSFVFSIIRLLASLALLIYKTDAYSIVCFIIIFTLQYHLMTTHTWANRQLKRYRATTDSLILSHLTESLNGLSTIRAFGKVNEFQKAIRSKIDIVNQTSAVSNYGHKWLSFNLSCLTSLVLLVVSV